MYMRPLTRKCTLKDVPLFRYSLSIVFKKCQMNFVTLLVAYYSFEGRQIISKYLWLTHFLIKSNTLRAFWHIKSLLHDIYFIASPVWSTTWVWIFFCNGGRSSEILFWIIFWTKIGNLRLIPRLLIWDFATINCNICQTQLLSWILRLLIVDFTVINHKRQILQ